ncbi:MAG: epoxyqueuosine reductase QueH [Lachnospiraceae bacterium]|nr:epoxyqueuosine reductase QueH [Lachnospiraceae bacterium]MDY5742192.1 epoxyqueuosine reductase QueH [Lachnospiraceae bacterium]
MAEQKKNYQKLMEESLQTFIRNEGRPPRVLLHSCCAPCSSYVLELLSQVCEVTVFFYNPNIYPEKEYYTRAAEQVRLINEMEPKFPIRMEVLEHRSAEFYQTVKGMEQEPEGRARCRVCYALRLDEAAAYASKREFDFFTTTLSVSPLKDSRILNELGDSIGAKRGIAYLHSDFKKKNGYKRSVELSVEHGLYRQDYCGCVFSKRDRDLRRKEMRA